MARWYGSVDNRLMETMKGPETIAVGMPVTEMLWSDRNVYEVIEVQDQKHVTIREMDHKPAPGAAYMSNDWVMESNEENPVYNLTKRGNYWYYTDTVTAEEWTEAKAKMDAGDIGMALSICRVGFDPEKIMAKGKQTKYRRANVVFGISDYYYDYEF